ncbi:dihydrolipoamide acetyltransferase family protein [Siminovitchia sediminis]|uniref:Dihydrolipoamide acetyltransferase component of pyruvate dehydrogenase complex n=1 Tax=Siminovitchia sediminis TaxID=1274353 RepID=A0ABW4KIA7_9BACI
MFEVKMPRTSDDIEESLIVFWHVEEGDDVEEGDVLVEVQTEKAVFEIEAETEGTIREILVKRGESAKIGETIATISDDQDNESAEEENDQKHIEKKAETGAGSQSFVRVSPRLRKLARDAGVNLSEIRGSGKGGVITESDIRNAAEGQTNEETGSGNKMSGIRKVIASRMMASLHESAQLTLTSWVDVTGLSQKRKESASKVSWNTLICYATVQALELHPEMNAHIEGDQITTYDQVHLGMAVDTESGLYVPVLTGAHELTIEKMDEELKVLAKKVASGNLSGIPMKGSTFTVTNLGKFGIEFFTPIIHPPEVGILGVGTIETHLALENGKVIQRERIPLSLTFDHRAVDGAPAAKFLQSVAGQCQALMEEL